MDFLTPEQRSERMRLIRGRDTKPERVVRQVTHAMGYRYRLHRRDLPGTPDLVFPARRRAIFVHGCFWHLHPDPSCRLARMPSARPSYWGPKLERNKQRDAENLAALAALGWECLVIWECQTKRRDQLEERIRTFLA